MKILRPCYDRVILARDEPTKKYGSLHVPEDAARRPETATVIGVGPGRRAKTTGERLPLDLQVGDRVAIGQWNVNNPRLDLEDGRGEREITVAKWEEIWAVVEESGERGERLRRLLKTVRVPCGPAGNTEAIPDSWLDSIISVLEGAQVG